MTGMRRRAVLLAAALAAASLPAIAQSSEAGKLFVRPLADVYFPLDTYTNEVTGATSKLYSSMGIVAGAALDYSLTGWLYPFARGDFLNMPYAGGNALTGGEFQLGLGFMLRPFDRVQLRLDAMGGVSSITIQDQSGTGFTYGGRLGAYYRLSPSFSIQASGGYSVVRGTQANILSAIEAGLGLSYDLSSLSGIKPKVAVESPKLEAVFPSLYAYYDDNAFGTIRVVNREDAAIKDVKVSFYSSRYMDQPKVCASYPELAKGEAVDVPMKALFSDTVLLITQGVDAKGEIVVEYSYLGSDLATRVPIDYRVHHRNAITWSDDRRAASFVSPTNPASLWFARYASGVVRDRMRGEINKPLQYAIGMFEAERVYGLNYVVVPANDYSVKHGLKDYIDSVQFPHQTLQNRGGDCSDLAILFASLMQSIGVDAAFITIPGHIFAAFDTGLTEEEAKASFYDPGLLIYKDGRAWIPVEITMVKDGFNKAWRIGAKEWYDNVRRGEAAFYRVPDCWRIYPPAAFPGVNPRFTLPPESEEAIAFDAALDRFVAREMGDRIAAAQARLAKESPGVRANEIGVLYAHYGMLKDSWRELSASAKTGCVSAWTNLGNVAYLRSDYRDALAYYQWAHANDPSDDNALLGMARCQYELEDFDASDASYAQLRQRDPQVAAKYGYLGSVFGGEGRAWSLSERSASTSWDSALGRKQASKMSAASAPDLPQSLDGEAPKEAAVLVKLPSSPAPETAAAPQPTAQPVAQPAVQPAAPAVAVAEPPRAAEKAQAAASAPAGFDSARIVLGAWSFEADKAIQSDKDIFYAKLALPFEQGRKGVYKYGFTVKSTAMGRGWVGAGAHLFAPDTGNFAGYGTKDSILVWLTRDPVHFDRDLTRLQVYRSTSNSWMELLGEAVVPESIYDENRIEARIDAGAGTVAVSLNGTERLVVKNLTQLKDSRYVVLRCLDTAEFKAFKAEAGE